MAKKTGSTMTVSRGKIKIGYTGKPLPGISAGRAAYQISVICNDGTSRQWTVLTKLDLYDDSKIKSNVGSNNKLRNLKRQGLIDSNTDIEVLIYDPFETLLDLFHAFLLNEGFSTKSAKSYLSRFRRGFEIYRSQTGKTLDAIHREFLRADDDGKRAILADVDQAVLNKYNATKPKNRAFKDVLSANSRFRDFLDKVAPSPVPLTKTSNPLDSAAEKILNFSHDALFDIFRARLKTWDRYYDYTFSTNVQKANARCFPFRIYAKIFAGDIQYLKYERETIENIEFIISETGPKHVLKLKEIASLEIDPANNTVRVTDNHGESYALLTQVVDKKGSDRVLTGYDSLGVDPKKKMGSVSIDHVNPMKDFYKQKTGSYKLPPNLELISQDIFDFLKNHSWAGKKRSKSTIPGEYADRWQQIPGLDKKILISEIKDLYRKQMCKLVIIKGKYNSSKNDKPILNPNNLWMP